MAINRSNRSNWAWQKGTYRSYNLKFRLDTDQDVIQYLDKQENKQNLIRNLIRKHMMEVKTNEDV